MTTTVPAIDCETAGSVESLLAAVESAEDVRICLAIESGSRAWGFLFADSDHDVRFVYVHRPEWYLSIDDGRDVSRTAVDRHYRFERVGHQKGAQTFPEVNPPLLEWLQSPLRLCREWLLAAACERCSPRFYDSNASFFHYLHMAQGNQRRFPLWGGGLAEEELPLRAQAASSHSLD